MGCECPLCFAYKNTPKYMKCCISGVQCGSLFESGMPSPPNGYFDLSTISPLYCQWTIVNPGPYAIVFKLFDTYSRLSVWGAPPGKMFEAQRDEKCVFTFDNMYTSPGGRYYYGGHAAIAISGELSGGGGNPPLNLSNVINKVTPMIDPDPRMECFPMSSPLVAIRYAGKRDATNVVIKFDPTLA